jgi:hypothetical protein
MALKFIIIITASIITIAGIECASNRLPASFTTFDDIFNYRYYNKGLNINIDNRPPPPPDDTPYRLVVRTAEGAIIGRREDNGKNKPFLAFQGIPYATPPLGQLRFRVSIITSTVLFWSLQNGKFQNVLFQSPIPHPKWEGIKLTVDYRDACLGYILRFLVGEEDCLFLNVFVPQVSSRNSINVSYDLGYYKGLYGTVRDNITWEMGNSESQLRAVKNRDPPFAFKMSD